MENLLDSHLSENPLAHMFVQEFRSAVRSSVAKPGHLNFPTWARQRLWIRSKSGPVIPFTLNPTQRRYLAMKRLARRQGRPMRFLLLKYRRGGFTTLEQGLSYEYAVNNSYAYVATLAHNQESTKRIFRIARLMRERDPESPRLKGGDAASKLEFAGVESYFFIGTAGGRAFGRGDTLQRVHGSEVSRWYENSTDRDGQVSELVAGLTEAASHGEVVLETTPCGIEWFCQRYREAKQGLNDWTAIFIPWYHDPTNRETLTPEAATEVLETLSEEERQVSGLYRLDAEQVAWRRRKQRELRRLFQQEYPENDDHCFLTSGQSWFSTERVLHLMDTVPDYPRRHVPGGYEVVWCPPEPGVEYVAGCDTSEGLPGCNQNGVGVLRRDTGEQVAAVHGLFKPGILAEHVVRLARMYNDAFVGVERENHGHTVVLKVQELGYRRKHQLYHFSGDRAGWSTNGETRPIMLDELAMALEDGSLKVRDRDFLSECLGFKLQPSGKFEHDPGCHDDTIFKWAIAWQMRKHRRPRPSISVG